MIKALTLPCFNWITCCCWANSIQNIQFIKIRNAFSEYVDVLFYRPKLFASFYEGVVPVVYNFINGCKMTEFLKANCNSWKCNFPSIPISLSYCDRARYHVGVQFVECLVKRVETCFTVVRASERMCEFSFFCRLKYVKNGLFNSSPASLGYISKGTLDT